jgi:hypothetical protein
MVVAHAGHWLTSALYTVPILAVAVAVWLQGRRDRRDGVTPSDDIEQPSLDDVLDGR